MADAATLHAAVVAQLKASVPNLTVYPGTVPDRPPADANGHVYPYAVVWDSPGTFPAAEAGTLAANDFSALSWTCRVTVASGNLDWLRVAAARTRKALVGFRPTRLSGQLSDEGTEPVTAKDPDITPVRYYVPIVLTMGAP